MLNELTQSEYVKKRIADNIKQIRNQQNIEVKQLCNDLGIAVSTYSNIERGVTDISISRILQLANYFSVHYAQIMSIDNTTIYQFSPQSHANSTQNNTNNQSSSLHIDGFQTALSQANQEIQYLREQNKLFIQKLSDIN